MKHSENIDELCELGIAVIGMAGRFPRARNVEEFWQNLCNGVSAVSFFTDEELIASGISPAAFNRPDYVRARGVIDDSEMFDASFFGMNPREAEIIDPQQRLFLEHAWEAFGERGLRSLHIQRRHRALRRCRSQLLYLECLFRAGNPQRRRRLPGPNGKRQLTPANARLL